MKKALLLLVAALVLLMPVLGNAGIYKGKEQLVAYNLSRYMAGAGEWYNGDFRGKFPWGECILSICPCVRISSVFDAVNGNTDDKIRFDFWTPPR